MYTFSISFFDKKNLYVSMMNLTLNNGKGTNTMTHKTSVHADADKKTRISRIGKPSISLLRWVLTYTRFYLVVIESRHLLTSKRGLGFCFVFNFYNLHLYP